MKVSVAIPTFEYYGRGVEFLDDMFRTIASQTLKDVEVVISDQSIDDEIKNFIQVCPKEMLDKLEYPITNTSTIKDVI